MINSIYYTFSTIAQALAGAIGLLGAFVLFRLQALSTEIESDASRIAGAIDQFQGHGFAESQLHGSQYLELLQVWAKTTFPSGFYLCERERARLPILLSKKDSLVRRFKTAFYLTIGLIMLSVSILAVAERLIGYPSLVPVIFVLGLVGLAVCLYSYISLMLESLK